MIGPHGAENAEETSLAMPREGAGSGDASNFKG